MESLNSLVGYWNPRNGLNDQRYNGPYSTPRFNQRSRHFGKTNEILQNQVNKSSETIKLFSKYRKAGQFESHHSKVSEIARQEALPLITTTTTNDSSRESNERPVGYKFKSQLAMKRKKSVYTTPYNPTTHLPAIHSNNTTAVSRINERKSKNPSVGRRGLLTRREDTEDEDWISDIAEVPTQRPEVVLEIDEEEIGEAILKTNKENSLTIDKTQRDQSGSSRRKSTPVKKKKLRHKRRISDTSTATPGSTAVLRVIPIAFFGQDNGVLQTVQWEDIDARSCDMRNPDTSVAYNNVLEYIRDNQLMSGRKAKLMWNWLNEVDKDLFIYDLNTNWFLQNDSENTERVEVH